MKNKRVLTIVLAIAIASMIAAFDIYRRPQTVSAQTDIAPPVHVAFGLVGITTGQTLRVNLVNIMPPDPNVPPPCRVFISFRDADGSLITNANGVVIHREADLSGGQSTFLNLNADNLSRTDLGGRIELRPDVLIQQPTNIPPPCIPTVEVINNLGGRTQFVMSALPAVQQPATIAG